MTWASRTTADAVGFAHEVHSTGRKEHLMSPTPQVLFVCVHNAGRSQMAAAFLSLDPPPNLM